MTALAGDLVTRGLHRSEYVALAERGSFDGERVELIDGEIITMSPIGKGHMQVVARIHRLLDRQLADGWMVSSQSSFVTSTRSQPEPDIAVIRDTSWELPTAAALIVEVMDSSRVMDLEIKPKVYGSAGIAVYAVVDLRDRVLHVHTGPTDGGYDHLELRRPGEPLRITEPPMILDISDVLPPA